MVLIKTLSISLILFLILCSTIVPCNAIEPVWTFSDENRKIEDIAVAPDGSTVVAGAGKVLFLSREGTILANEPYGERLTQSQDGSSIVTEYSSTVSSTVYLFKKKTDAGGNQTLQKMWEAPQPHKIVSFAVSDNGERIACSAGTNDVFVLDGTTGARLGNDENISSRVAVSGRGTLIAGISLSQGLKSFNSKGGFIKEYDIPLSGQTNSLLIDTNGSIVVFNTGMNLIAVNISNGSDMWKQENPSEINMLAMTPSGEKIVAGTSNGTIDLYDKNGNLSWTYYSNSGTGSGQAIKAVSLTHDGSIIIAGSADGKIILFDETGTPQWIYKTKNKPINRVAIAADGSLAVASSENIIYAFSTDDLDSLSTSPVTSVKIPFQTLTSGEISTTVSETRSLTEKPVSTKQSYVQKTPTISMTEYSIVHKATQSPLEGTTEIVAILIIFFIVIRKGNE
jgi:WD40 repeat protein